MKLWETIYESMIANPLETVQEKDEKYTYIELINIAEQFSKQIKKEKCCAIYCDSELHTAIVLLSCFMSGVTAVPLSKRYGQKHCQNILRKISPSCVVTDANGYFEVYRISDTEYNTPHRHPAVIMCTSGTTGSPKGVMLSEENIISNLQGISNYLQIDNNDTILISRPIYHSAVLTGEFLISLLKGVNIVFYSENFDPQKIYGHICEKHISVFGGTPTMLDVMARYIQRIGKDGNLKHITISGECMSKATGMRIQEHFPNANIYHVYGLTESSPRVSYMPASHFLEHPDCVGKPLEKTQIEIRDNNGNVLRNGEIGHLWIKSDSVMMGYYNDPELTEQTIKKGWLHTGDIAAIKSNGWLKIYGRSDDMIIRAGMNIYPAEIESELKKDIRVRDVLAYGFDDRHFGTRIALKISGDFGSVDEVKKLCIDILPPFQIPSKIELVEKFSQNGSGKIIRGGTV